jgi:hypothetical protein
VLLGSLGRRLGGDLPCLGHRFARCRDASHAARPLDLAVGGLDLRAGGVHRALGDVHQVGSVLGGGLQQVAGAEVAEGAAAAVRVEPDGLGALVVLQKERRPGG